MLQLGLLALTPIALANTPLLVNPDLASLDGWNAGSNLFVGGVWSAFVGTPNAYTIDSRVVPSGAGHVFSSWDDGTSDTLENYLYQEFNAGPLTGPTPTIFDTGDVIVFKGRASATRSGTDTSDMVVRAFIKVLGYNEFGWSHQIKDQYSAFQPIGSTLQDFELRVTYPDLAVDDSLQLLQIGFEITNSFDGSAMDSGTIYFESLEGYIEGADPEMWGPYTVETDGTIKWVVTGSWLGTLDVTDAMADVNNDWVYSYRLKKWVYIPRGAVSLTGGSWVYIRR